MMAANKRDIPTLKRYIKEENALDNVNPMVTLHLQLSLAAAEQSDKDIDPKLKRKLKRVLNESGWNMLSCDFLGESMAALDIDDAYQLLHSAIAYYKKSKRFNLLESQTIVTSTVNFLNNCYHKNGKIEYVEEAINFLKSLPLSVHIMYGRFFATYYEALYKENDKTLEQCVAVFKKSGYYQILQDTYEDYLAKKKTK